MDLSPAVGCCSLEYLNCVQESRLDALLLICYLSFFSDVYYVCKQSYSVSDISAFLRLPVSSIFIELRHST
jgi:hypothetical protein